LFKGLPRLAGKVSARVSAMESYDVFIVGGGMSGSNLARFCAEGGLNTLFIERYKTPRHKPCSGIQFPYFEKILDVKIPPEILCRHQIRKTHMELPDGKVMGGPFKAFNYMRNVFDNWLNELAVAAGAKFLTECTYQDHRQEGERIVVSFTGPDGESREANCKYLVDASGLNSLPVRKKLRPEDFTENAGSGGMNYYVSGPADLDPETLYGFYDVRFSDAMFAWIYNKTLDDGKDYWCIGTGCVDGTIEQRQELFFNYVKEKFNIQGEIKQTENFVSNMDYSSKERVWLGQDNILMVGDAAGFLDGVRGVGQDAAALSARLCAQALVQAEKEGIPALGEYQRLAARIVKQTRKNQEMEIAQFKSNEELQAFLRKRFLAMFFSMTYQRLMNKLRKPERLVLQ
jgi:flavin-dependent dehydrogenase